MGVGSSQGEPVVDVLWAAVRFPCDAARSEGFHCLRLVLAITFSDRSRLIKAHAASPAPQRILPAQHFLVACERHS